MCCLNDINYHVDDVLKTTQCGGRSARSPDVYWIIRKPRLTRPRKICYKYQRETAEIGVEKNEKKDLDDPGMHHIHEFLHGRMYWQYKQEEIEWQDKNYNKFLHHV